MIVCYIQHVACAMTIMAVFPNCRTRDPPDAGSILCSSTVGALHTPALLRAQQVCATSHMSLFATPVQFCETLGERSPATIP
jgi:hypothetical protein